MTHPTEPIELSTRFWQVAAGSDGHGRDYADAFLRYGMAFVGDKVQEATMAQVRAGDVMILKRGMSQILAVGKVVERDGHSTGNGDKTWLNDFDGWGLPGYCYVAWHQPDQPVPAKGLTRASIQSVHQWHLKEEARRLLEEVPPLPAVSPEPKPTHPVDDAKILEFLVSEGLRPAAAEDLNAAFRRIRLLARYYYDSGWWGDVREHETRAFLIMPLLLALGWAEQQIKIELATNAGGKIDVACFAKPYRRDANGQPNNKDCVLILESKGFRSGLNYAPDQAVRYARSFESCRVIVATNGYCYKAYSRNSADGFDAAPSAYLNLLNPQDRYPLDPDNVAGALEMLKLLLPRTW